MQANTDLFSELRGRPRMADFVVEALLRSGCRHAFGMGADSLTPLVDAMRKRPELTLIPVRHEGNGALMASSYAKLSGRPGVCMAAGPGATHLPLGIYDARADCVPLIVLTGQVPSHQVGAGGFQEIDPSALFDDAVGFTRLVASPRQAPLISLACQYAVHHHAPVNLTLPGDVLRSSVEPNAALHIDPNEGRARILLSETVVAQAATWFGDGDAVIVVTAGAGTTQEQVEQVAERLRAPIVVVPAGNGWLRRAPRGTVVRHGGTPDDPAQPVLASTRRVLLVGHLGSAVAALLPRGAALLQVANATQVLRPSFRGAARLCGDVAATLTTLCPYLRSSSSAAPLRLADELRLPRDTRAQRFWRDLLEHLPADAIITVDPGPILRSLFMHLPEGAPILESSFNFAARGYALPAAIGAALAQPGRPTFAITSPEGMSEAMPDLMTARQQRLPITTLCVSGAGTQPAIDFSAYAHATNTDVFVIQGENAWGEALRKQTHGPKVLVAHGPSLESPPADALRADSPGSTTLAELLATSLAQAGVQRVYGKERPAARPLIEALRRTGRVVFVPVAHGESAAMMASALAKRTGQICACLATDGPDLVLLLNGLYDAAFDHSPLLALTYLHEEADPPGVPAPQRLLKDVARRHLAIRGGTDDPAQIAEAVAECARTRGVIHLAMDLKMLSQTGYAAPLLAPTSLTEQAVVPEPERLREAARRLQAARLPVILVGRGAWGATEPIRRLAQRLHAPIVCTMPGRGVFPDDDPYFVGAVGTSGHLSAVETIKLCDLLLVLGTSSRGVVFELEGDFTVIQVDRDPTQLGRRPHRIFGLYGTTAETAAALLEALGPATGASLTESALASRWEQFLELQPLERLSDGMPKFIARFFIEQVAGPLRQQALRRRYAQRPGAFLRAQRAQHERWLERSRRDGEALKQPIPPSAICSALLQALEASAQRAIVTVDVGVTTLWVFRHFIGGNHDVVWTASFATMGFAMPAALAIAETEPRRPVVAIAGDGGLAITMAELASAVARRVPVVVIVFNNSKLAAVRFELEVMGWPDYGADLYNCDFAAFARACGARGLRVTEPGALVDTLREALQCGEPCLVDVVCDPDEMPAPPRVHLMQGSAYLVALAREAQHRRKTLQQAEAPAALAPGPAPPGDLVLVTE